MSLFSGFLATDQMPITSQVKMLHERTQNEVSLFEFKVGDCLRDFQRTVFIQMNRSRRKMFKIASNFDRRI